MDEVIASQQQQRPQNQLANYKFSSEELRVLQQCNTESFYQRSLPLGTGFGVAAYLAVKNGYIQPNVRYGAVPKVVVGVIMGYFVGKFSYQQKCAEKLMRLPNSRLGELLRERRQSGGVMSSITPDQNLSVGIALAPFTSEPVDVYTDDQMFARGRSNALNLDSDNRPTISGLDDIYRPSLDDPQINVETDLPIEPVKPGVSYDDLRKRNRENYNKRYEQDFSAPLSSGESPKPHYKPNPKYDEQENPAAKGQKNKYGDTWIE